MDRPRTCMRTLLHTTHTLASTFIFGAVAEEFLVFVDIDFFFYLNWFYFSTSLVNFFSFFFFLQFCLFIFHFSFCFDLGKKKKKFFLVFWCLLQKFQNSVSAKRDQVQPVAIEHKRDQPARLRTTILNPRLSTKPTNAWVQALDARAHLRSIASSDSRAQLRSIAWD